jgi:hypothetical protein
MALIHFIFELFKILVQSTIYSSIIFFTITYLVKPKPGSLFYFFKKKRALTLISSWIVIFFGLFLFMFSYYGDHGLGDSARIPIGHHREIQQTDLLSHIEQKKNGAIYINEFVITNDYVYGKLDKYNIELNQNYFVYDLKSDAIHTFDQQEAFNNYLASEGLNQGATYQSFDFYYSQYWSGWRFWLLP